MRWTRRHPTLPVTGLLLAAGCASLRSVPRDELLTRAPIPDGRTCWVAPDPARLPDPAQLLDAGAFGTDAARLWAQAGRPAGYVIFSVRHSPDGAQVRRAVIESTLPAALSDTLRKLVYAYRRETRASPAEWGVRLRVDPGEQVALRVGRRLECTARPRGWEYRTAGAPFDVRQGADSSVAIASLTDLNLVWVHVRLNAQGMVTDARVERSPARGPWEQRLLSYVRTMTFDPALEDGQPVPGETTIPLRLSMAR